MTASRASTPQFMQNQSALFRWQSLMTPAFEELHWFSRGAGHLSSAILMHATDICALLTDNTASSSLFLNVMKAAFTRPHTDHHEDASPGLCVWGAFDQSIRRGHFPNTSVKFCLEIKETALWWITTYQFYYTSVSFFFCLFNVSVFMSMGKATSQQLGGCHFRILGSSIEVCQKRQYILL